MKHGFFQTWISGRFGLGLEVVKFDPSATPRAPAHHAPCASARLGMEPIREISWWRIRTSV